MRAYRYAGITIHAPLLNPSYFNIILNQCFFRAVFHTNAAVDALVDGVWIMAVQAVEITPLQKDHSPVSRPVHEAGLYDLINLSVSHVLSIIEFRRFLLLNPWIIG